LDERVPQIELKDP